MDTVAIDYGNWVPKKSLIALPIFFVAAGILSFASFCWPPVLAWPSAVLWAVRCLLLLCALLALVMGAIMTAAYRLFSYRGGQVSAKILDELVGRIEWDGQGQALDIGCGSGALSVRVAKRFPQAKLTGIDYWGAEWDYAKEQCEENARLEGVGERIEFRKGDAAALPFEDGAFDLAVSNFVFHEVKSQPNKRLVIKEALRVVTKGSPFVFHDLFYCKPIYGSADDLLRELRSWGLTEVHMERTSERPYIPHTLRLPIFLQDIGVIYGIR